MSQITGLTDDDITTTAPRMGDSASDDTGKDPGPTDTEADPDTGADPGTTGSDDPGPTSPGGDPGPAD